MNHGAAGYTAAKHGVVGLMRDYAVSLAEKNIRVNTVHPVCVATPMASNGFMQRFSAEHPGFAAAQRSLLPAEVLDPVNITAAMAYLAGNPAAMSPALPCPTPG